MKQTEATMEEKASRSQLKRSFLEDEDSAKPSMQKRARFPKGKKVKAGEQVVGAKVVEESTSELPDPDYSAKERAKRRGQMTTELFIEENRGMISDISSAEVNYEDSTNFVEDGIQIEPFNLNQEREEGYFDAEGNFVEYVNEKEIKDAWLDSIEVDSRFAEKKSDVTKIEEEVQDLSSEDIGKIKRRIASLLEPGETVLQALRRLKGTSNDRKERMPEETKLMFDQLTEDAMKLMENGDYNVYHDRQEVFDREAEGYERLARARDGTSSTAVNGSGEGLSSTAVNGSGEGTSSTAVNGSGADTFDMFAEDDENPATNPSSDGHNLGSGPDSELSQPSSENLNINSESGDLQNDYVFDESSGYYYSSSLGYYYDPTSGLYCCASSGRWYSYNEQTGTYEEVQGAHQEVHEAVQSVAQG